MAGVTLDRLAHFEPQVFKSLDMCDKETMEIPLDSSLQSLSGIRLKRVCADLTATKGEGGDEQKSKRAKITDDTETQEMARTFTLVANGSEEKKKEQETKTQITPVQEEWSLALFYTRIKNASATGLDCFDFLSRSRKYGVSLTPESIDVQITDPVEFVCLSSFSAASQELTKTTPEFCTDGMLVDLDKQTIDVWVVDTEGHRHLLDQVARVGQLRFDMADDDHAQLASKIKMLDKNLAHTEDVQPSDILGASLLLLSLMLRRMPITGQDPNKIKVELTQFRKGGDVHVTASGFERAVSTGHLRSILQQFPSHIRDIVFAFPSAEVGRGGTITVVFSPEKLAKQSILI